MLFFNLCRKVNKKFAEITLDALRRMLKEKPKETPIVWIHDYQLMVAANTVRQVCTTFVKYRHSLMIMIMIDDDEIDDYNAIH